MKQTTMNLRTDYTRVALDLNGGALDKKLEELTRQTPPRSGKRLADLLGPYTERLRKLHTQGWTYRQLAEELRLGGLPVGVGTLREHLVGKSLKRRPGGRSAAPKTAPGAAPCAPKNAPPLPG